MLKTVSNEVLRRKAQAARQVHETRAMTPGRALRLAMAKSADTLLSLPLTVTRTHRGTLAQDSLVDRMSDDWLLILLDGPGGALGVAALDMAALTALVEQQTMGRIGARQAAPRRATRTDAALVAPFLDDSLSRFASSLGSDPDSVVDHAQVAGYRFGAMIEDRRSLGLALQADDFQLFALDLDLGLGARMGQALLAFPIVETSAEDRAVELDTAEAWMTPTVMRTQAVLDVQLCQVSIPLADLGRLKPGDVLPIDRSTLERVMLRGADGRTAIRGHLGKMGDLRAVRLCDDTLPESEGDADIRASEPEAPARPRPAESAKPAPKARAPSVPEAAPVAAPQALPDLPPLDFDAPAFDVDGLPPLPNLGEFDFDAAPLPDLT